MYVYRTPLELELLDRGVPFKREVQYPIVYKGKRTGIAFRVDLVCYGEVIVELKAMKALTGAEHAQVINYLHASGLERGLLLNFGTPILTIERFVHTAGPDARRAANLTDPERAGRQEGEQQRDEGRAQT